MRRADRGATVVIDACGVVGHIGYLGQEGRKGVGVLFCGEESIDIARSCTEEQVYSRGGWMSLCLSTAAEVIKLVESGIAAWEFPGLVRAKVGIRLSYPKGRFQS
jgi:hypothetical protein